MIECKFCEGKDQFICMHGLYKGLVDTQIEIAKYQETSHDTSDFEIRAAKQITAMTKLFNNQDVIEFLELMTQEHYPNIYKKYLAIKLLK